MVLEIFPSRATQVLHNLSIQQLPRVFVSSCDKVLFYPCDYNDLKSNIVETTWLPANDVNR